MVIDREEGMYFYFQFVYVHATLSASKGIFMDHGSQNNCGFSSQELTISRPFWRLVHGTHEGFVLRFYQAAYSVSSISSIDNDS